jgi:lipoprotein-releasing system permease protein
MYKFLLSTRYLRTRFIALASIISVMLGVATMIVVNSVMAGFGVEMKDRLHGILADVIISTNSMNGVPDAGKWMDLIQKVGGDQIAGMTASVEVYGMMTFNLNGEPITRPVTLVGIEPRGKAKVGPLKEYLVSYQQGLRDPDSEPGWELTDEAREYRQNLVYFNNPWEDSMEPLWSDDKEGDLSAENPDAEGPVQVPELSTPESEVPPFAPEAGSPTAPEQPIPAPKSEASATNEDSWKAVPAAEPKAKPDAGQPKTNEPYDPFLDQQNKEILEKPSTDPKEGRVYVGINLISYKYTDPQTGKVHDRMMVRPGDDISISTVGTSMPPSPVSLAVTVTDILKTGMSEYDSNLIFCNLKYLQEVRGMVHGEGDGVRDFTTIQIKLKDYENAPEIVRKLKAAFPPHMFTVQTWEDKQGPLLAAVEMESAILNVLLFLIIAVAGFGILAIFFMIVVEKTRDIGIMKALGASSNGIMSIFLSYGLALGIVGSGVGVGLGLLFVHYINQIEDALSWLTGRPVFSEEIYYFSEIPTMVSPLMVFWVALGAVTIAVLASILPARRASKLHPVQSLRYE